ncbi:flagellar protein FliT [Psychrobacillus sp. NPDC096426]|uniref:flagellar protein FliT n=1 Tax=Psychrobacillus sp. NPDC096426 TaxID=3364491 RepID=UPI00380B2882
MGEVENFLTASEKLYNHLINTPTEDKRDEFIEQINILLDVREQCIEEINVKSPLSLKEYDLYETLLKLDQGIIKELEKVMTLIKTDIKSLQQKKRHESSYTNPYAATQTMDGMYFDNKK